VRRLSALDVLVRAAYLGNHGGREARLAPDKWNAVGLLERCGVRCDERRLVHRSRQGKDQDAAPRRPKYGWSVVRDAGEVREREERGDFVPHGGVSQETAG
jgi:hypothetical protein